MNNRLLILLFLPLLALSLKAQDKTSHQFDPGKKITQYIIDSWDNQDGLPSNGLLYITQASDGYIWITSFNGLIRFDGARFTLFNTKNIPFLKNNIFEDLAEDRDGTLWIGTQGNGLVSCKNKSFTAHFPDSANVPFIKKPFVDRDNIIWFGTQQHGAYRYDRKTFRRYEITPGKSSPTVIGIAQAADGTMWFSTEGKGVFYLQNDRMIPLEQPLPSAIVNSINVDSKNRLWISTGLGLCRWDGREMHYFRETQGYDCFKVVEDHAGYIWVAMTIGVARINPATDQMEFLTPKNGSPIRYAFSMTIDKEGSLWVTSYRGGLHRIKDTKLTHFSIQEGFRGKICNALCALDSQTVLAGFDDGLIDIIRDGNVSPFLVRQNLVSRRIRHMIRDSKRNVWVGTYGGLLRIDASGRETWFSKQSGLKDDRVRAVFEDSKGNIWFGTRGEGMFRMSDGKPDMQYSTQNGLGSNFIMSVSEDTAGRLWVGTSGGGLNIIRTDGTVEVHNDKTGFRSEIVFQVYFDRAGTAWIAINGGIARFRNGTFSYWTQREGFPADSPFDIVEDEDGSFWSHTSSGLLVVSSKSLNEYLDGNISVVDFSLLTKKNGLKETEGTATSKALKMPDGSLWFPTINGVVKINPKSSIHNSVKPPVYIERIIADDSITENPTRLDIPPGTKRLTIEFTALSLLYPENVMFQYQLQGFETNWSSPSNGRSVQYTNLPYGEYLFRVIASNNDGVWNETGASVKLILSPPFWQTWWAWTVYGLLTAGLIYGIIHWRTLRLKKRSRELEAKVEERTLELKQAQVQLIHASKLASLGEMVAGIAHEINNPVGFIQGNLDYMKQTIGDIRSAGIQNDIQPVLQDLSESVDVSLSGTRRIKSIVDQLRNFSKFQQSDFKDIRIHPELDTVLDLFFKQHPEIKIEKTFDPALDNLMLSCIAEEINLCWYNILINAVQAIHDAEEDHVIPKGSGMIMISTLRVSPDSIRVIVQDNGIGMNKDVQAKIFDPFFTTRRIGMGRGLGLTETYGIIQKHRGTIDLTSEPGKGTAFRVTLPVKLK